MKLFIKIAFMLSGITCYAQSIPTTTLTINDVYNAKELVFYGFDFSNFRLIEPDRINEGASIRDINFPSWNAYVITELPMNKLAKWFKKDNITYFPLSTTILNSKVPDGNVVARLPYSMDVDAVKNSVSKYEKPSNVSNKIGMVVNVESFLKSKNETSAYVTFFDISNGAVIASEKMTNNTAQGQGLTNYWAKSLFYTLKFYSDKVYSKGL